LVDPRILRKAHKSRAIDGKEMILGLVLDHDNAYKYENSQGKEVILTPRVWIILEVT
jgi:hypothetical protein